MVTSPDTSASDALHSRGFLGLTLGAYLPEGHPTIQLAAEIVGTSVRTFQRQLALLGISYSDLVQQVRFEVATELLADAGIRMSDIALAVG